MNGLSRIIILLLFVAIMLFACTSPATTPTAIPTVPPIPTTIATTAPTVIPTATTDPYATWSTNFSNVTDPTTEGMEEWSGSGAQLSIDTMNVNSGGNSIKDSGTIDNQHMLQAVFSIHGLTGRDGFDLSDKMLSIEMYVPGDSPFSILYIQLMSGNNTILVRENIPPQKGRWYTYAVDLNMVINLGSWQYADWMHSPGISSQAEAVNLLKDVQKIMIGGSRFSDKGAPAYFLIDKLGWQPAVALPAYDPSVDSLQKYAKARNMLIGTFLDMPSSSNPQIMRNVLQEFGGGAALTIDWPAIEPVGDDFDAAVQVPQDIFLDNVEERLSSPLIRYAIYPWTGIPDWLSAKSYEETKTILENYVRALVSSHKGKTKIWYVFNEILRYYIGKPPNYIGIDLKDRNQKPQTWQNDYSPFSNSPSDVSMIEDTFRVAREADPNALLFLNDGCGVEEMGQAKSEAYYNLAAKLVKDGTPIDGVGLQAHLYIGKDGKVYTSCSFYDHPLAFNSTDGLPNVAKNVERYQALGLKAAFAEADVSFWTTDIDSTPAGQQRLAERLQLQAQVYRSLMHIALTHSNVVAFVFQGWADEFAWMIDDPHLHDYGDSGIFDANWQPKPAYYAILAELKGP